MEMERIIKRMASPETMNTELNKKAKKEIVLGLTDLNDECLMNIFKLFSIKDLLNIAEADGRFITAAQKVFRRNYSKSLVKVSNKFDSKTETTSMSVQLMKHFGEIITKLKVVYFKKYCRFNDMLDDMILKKCQKSLTEIEIENGDQLIFHKIAHPFEELCKISFVSSGVPDVIIHFEKWFPKASTLELKQLKVEKYIKNDKKKASPCEDNSDNDSQCDSTSDSGSDSGFYGKPLAALSRNYPTGEHFAISNVPQIYKCENRVRNRDIQKFIELNPQLKSLLIESDDIDHDAEEMWWEGGHSSWSYDGIEVEPYLVACIEENLSILENFHLIWKTGESNEGCEISFKQLKTLTIEFDIRSGHFYVATDNVSILNIVVLNKSDRYCLDLIKWNKKAEIINISGNWCNKKYVTETIKRIIALPNLKELRFPYKNECIKKKDIILLLGSCKKLTKLSLDFDRDVEVFETASKEFDAGIDITKIGWEIVSQENWQLVFNRKTSTLNSKMFHVIEMN